MCCLARSPSEKRDCNCKEFDGKAIKKINKNWLSFYLNKLNPLVLKLKNLTILPVLWAKWLTCINSWTNTFSVVSAETEDAATAQHLLWDSAGNMDPRKTWCHLMQAAVFDAHEK